MGIAEDVAIFEQNLTDLVIRYEQYFLGLEKRAPLKLQEEVEKYVRKYSNVNIVNTMLKFRYNSIVARYSSYKQYWNRILRLMEEGKYSRDRFKMEMNQFKKSLRQPVVEHPVNPEIEVVYKEYIKARKACSMPTKNVTPEVIADIIAKQKPAIIKKHRCHNVEFKVIIEEGVPKIKVRPKK